MVDRSAGAELANNAWYRDVTLWMVVLAALTVRIIILLSWMHYSPHSAWLQHVNDDLTDWIDLFALIDKGLIPYVDLWVAYPVLTGSLYWLVQRFMGTPSLAQLVLVHALAIAAFDTLNTGLFYRLARASHARHALLATCLFTFGLTTLFIGPMRFESVLVTTLLVGYGLHRRGHTLLATVVWSIGCALKWYPTFLFAAQELNLLVRRESRHHWLKASALFAGVQVALNAPFLIASWVRHGSVRTWAQTYIMHAERELSPDTLLGVAQLWWGPVSLERWASVWTLALIALALLWRPTLPLSYKSVLVAIAALIFNRIYSPQFNLWFYPFLLLLAIEQRPKVLTRIVVLFVAQELCNVVAFPFGFTQALRELGTFGPGIAGEKSAYERPWTLLWSACVVLRAGVLLALARELLRCAPAARRHASA